MTTTMPAPETIRPSRPNIPRAKRAGLDLDLARICAAGPDALEPDDHYRLKTYGVCAQRQDDLFMIRMRVAGGLLDRHHVATVVELARRHADGNVHLTTRQNLELHSVRLGAVPEIYGALAEVGLAGRSACGHTIRNVMACPESATSIEEPFDVLPDAQRLSRLLVARSSELNVVLPSRLNIVLGGCRRCGLDALVNDIGLVARSRESTCGYGLWVGGSLGSAPRLSVLLRPFLRREEVWPAVWTVVEWFCQEGDIDQLARGRLKFLIEARGEAALRRHFSRRFPELCELDQPPIPPVEAVSADLVTRALALAPPGGWSDGIRPERVPGRAGITVRVPRGELTAHELEQIALLAPHGELRLSRDQNVVISGVPTDTVPAIISALGSRGLGPEGVRSALDVTACPGLRFCSLALTGSQEIAAEIESVLAARSDLPRHVSIAISGCPNSCARQQAADIGLAGTKLRLGGRTELGYQLSLGADLTQGQVGQPLLKLREREVPNAVAAVLESWAALRRPGEVMAATFRRVGLERVAGAIALRLRPETDRFVTADEGAA